MVCSLAVSQVTRRSYKNCGGTPFNRSTQLSVGPDDYQLNTKCRTWLAGRGAPPIGTNDPPMPARESPRATLPVSAAFAQAQAQAQAWAYGMMGVALSELGWSYFTHKASSEPPCAQGGLCACAVLCTMGTTESLFAYDFASEHGVQVPHAPHLDPAPVHCALCPLWHVHYAYSKHSTPPHMYGVSYREGALECIVGRRRSSCRAAAAGGGGPAARCTEAE
jgi:hypothetical protein